MIVHNLTELLVYPGIAVIFVSLLTQWSPIKNLILIIFLLILISIYDMWAVWHSGIMQKMAKYQIDTLEIFSGFFIPDFVINRAILKLNISYIFCQSRFSLDRMKKVCRNILEEVEITFFRPPALFEDKVEMSKENNKQYRAEFNILENDFVILHSGLGSLLRGVDYVVEIFEKLLKEHNTRNVKLFLAIFHVDRTGTNKKYIDNLKSELEKK